MNNVQLNQTIVIVAEAVSIARTFPGVLIWASTTEEWCYHISTPDSRYDRKDVPLEQLRVEAANVVTELQSRFGEHGEGLDDLVLNLRINSALVGN